MLTKFRKHVGYHNFRFLPVNPRYTSSREYFNWLQTVWMRFWRQYVENTQTEQLNAEVRRRGSRLSTDPNIYLTSRRAVLSASAELLVVKVPLRVQDFISLKISLMSIKNLLTHCF